MGVGGGGGGRRTDGRVQIDLRADGEDTYDGVGDRRAPANE